MPVHHHGGRFAAALSVVGTTEQIPMDAIESTAETLMHTASAILPAVSPEHAAS